ncbi:MAG TPA: pyridoxamine 5'-phosphate oxidase family protein [Acidimicrobiia bacterium]|nr:pyridoxamine 5'-phosphate oxidase family protein [Acidimicrobiia bacterium]
MTDARLEPLSQDVCLQLLREAAVGRIAVVVGADPVILPVNYRLIEPASGPYLALRTRPGNVVDHALPSVAFEIDSIDSVRHQGWSVLVRGELLHANPVRPDQREAFDPESWLPDRDSWLLIDPWQITGRELHGAESEWQFRPGEYM